MAKIFNLNDTIGGWFIGNYDKTIINTFKFEVAIKKYKSNDYEESHFHLKGTEVTTIVKGEVLINGEKFIEGDIITIYPGEAINFKCITDVITCVVKIPSERNDKYFVTNDTKYKICVTCEFEKVEEAFQIKDKKTNRRSTKCSTCSKKQSQEYYILNRNAILERVKLYNKNNPEKQKEHSEKETAKIRKKQGRNASTYDLLYSRNYYKKK